MAGAQTFASILVFSRLVPFVLAGTAAAPSGGRDVTPEAPLGADGAPSYTQFMDRYVGNFAAQKPQGTNGAQGALVAQAPTYSQFLGAYAEPASQGTRGGQNSNYMQFMNRYAGDFAAQNPHSFDGAQSASGAQAPSYSQFLDAYAGGYASKYMGNDAGAAQSGSKRAQTGQNPNYMQFMNRYAGNFAALNPQSTNGAQSASNAQAPSYSQFMDAYAGGYGSKYTGNDAGAAQSGSKAAQTSQNSNYMQYMDKYAGGYAPNGTSGVSNTRGNTGYQQYMDKYAGGGSGFQQYMGGFTGSQSSPDKPAPNSSTPSKNPDNGSAAEQGFAKYMARYLPKGDNDAHSSKWTQQWSNMSAPYEGMYSGGKSGYDQYVDKYSAMAGKDVSSPGSWQEKAKSQKDAFANAIGPGGNATSAEALMVAAESKPVTEAEPMAASALAPASAFGQRLQLCGWVVLGLTLPGALALAGRLLCRPRQVEPASLRYLQLV